jgi:hypothetical protein
LNGGVEELGTRRSELAVDRKTGAEDRRAENARLLDNRTAALEQRRLHNCRGCPDQRDLLSPREHPEKPAFPINAGHVDHLQKAAHALGVSVVLGATGECHCGDVLTSRSSTAQGFEDQPVVLVHPELISDQEERRR